MPQGAATPSRDDGVTYDRIGVGYARYRRPDARIASAIHAALGSAASVLNVGAGSGSYEPAGRVVALEPSFVMIRQRTAAASARVVQARAEALPFLDRRFDAAMAVLTIHHWDDWRAGVAEMLRVASSVTILTWDPAHDSFWLVRDYFPEILDVDRRIFPTVEELSDALGGAVITPVPVPADCSDGFLGAYWARPASYLDRDVRSAVSAFANLTDVEEKLARLADDLRTRRWHERHAELLDLAELDVGYRVITTNGPRESS